VHNELPPTWPLVAEGITIHWHGFDMRGAEFYDGVAYLQQCPVMAGGNFTYRFTVPRPPPALGARAGTRPRHTAVLLSLPVGGWTQLARARPAARRRRATFLL